MCGLAVFSRGLKVNDEFCVGKFRVAFSNFVFSSTESTDTRLSMALTKFSYDKPSGNSENSSRSGSMSSSRFKGIFSIFIYFILIISSFGFSISNISRNLRYFDD